MFRAARRSCLYFTSGRRSYSTPGKAWTPAPLNPWKPPVAGALNIVSDASWYGDKSATTAAILRNNVGDVLRARVKHHPTVRTSSDAETLGISEGITMFLESGYRHYKVTIDCDCDAAVRYVYDKRRQVPKDLIEVIKDIRDAINISSGGIGIRLAIKDQVWAARHLCRLARISASIQKDGDYNSLDTLVKHYPKLEAVLATERPK